MNTKAKDISGSIPGGARTRLAESLPLSAPFVIEIFPIYACNFKCIYCLFSIKEEKRYHISNEVMMDFYFYKKCIDDISDFPRKLKCLRFTGVGEPLLHPKIAEMVRYAAYRNVSERIELVTNAAYLSHKLSDALADSGLSKLLVSIQGNSNEVYQKIAGVDVEFENILDNVKYFFTKKGRVHVYCKCVDIALDTEEEVNTFYKTFGAICDTIAVERIVPIHPGVNFARLLGESEIHHTQFGLSTTETKVCPQPFFIMRINPDGDIVPCLSMKSPKMMGNCYMKSVVDIWNGETFRDFRYKTLISGSCIPGCQMMKHRLAPEDILDQDRDRLKNIYCPKG